MYLFCAYRTHKIKVLYIKIKKSYTFITYRHNQADKIIVNIIFIPQTQLTGFLVKIYYQDVGKAMSNS